MGVPLSEFSKYPAMSPAEVEIFKRWAALHEKEYDRFDFNVRVGKGIELGPTYSESARANARLNSQKRIDAVGYKGPQPTIIEVKDRAGASALGEILTYGYLYVDDHPDQPSVYVLLVTNTLQPDMETVLIRFHIPWELVPPG